MNRFDSRIVKVGKYQLVPLDEGGKLGDGTFGKVFKAIDTETKELCALKMIPKYKIDRNPYTQELFGREIQIHQAIKHKNIVKVFEVFQTNDDYVIVTEICDGGALDKMIEVNYFMMKSGLSESLVIEYLKGFLQGYKVLYDNKIIHRDIKPANLLLHNGIIKIADFGLARYVDSDNLYKTPGVGTPIFMAPEMLSKKMNYDAKCDVWALGITLHEALFGIVPWATVRTREELEEVVTNSEKNPYIFPGNPNSVFKPLLESMLAFDPSKRISWEELFSHSINQVDTINLERLSITLFSDSIEKEKDKKKHRIQIIEVSKRSQEQLLQKRSKGIEILKQVTIPVDAGKGVKILKDEHISNEEMENILEKEQCEKVFKQNTRVIEYHIKVAHYLLYRFSKCQLEFKNKKNLEEIPGFYTTQMNDLLEGLFMKTSCMILYRFIEMKDKDELGLKMVKEYIEYPHYRAIKERLESTFKTFNALWSEAREKLIKTTNYGLFDGLTTDSFSETAEHNKFIREFETCFLEHCSKLLEKYGPKKHLLVVAHSVIDVVNWKELTKTKEGRFQELEKLLELVEGANVEKLQQSVKEAVTKRLKKSNQSNKETQQLYESIISVS